MRHVIPSVPSSARAFVIALAAVLLVALVPVERAEAFCGFYVSGGTTDLFNEATTVVMMRDGMRTVLSMQNSYKGPPKDFAMVVPVPIVLKKDNVKTLDGAIFDKVDAMAAPRLVEYWEQDPCYQPALMDRGEGALPMATGMPAGAGGGGRGAVTVEARFKVGEYDIVILSATEATALDKWLKANKYNIPAGAKDAYTPYIEKGMYFFVARVDVAKVKFVDGRAELSPLRFHYDHKEFSLPVRLGLINAKGAQDLIVHILARGQRYEVANLDNVTIPTNIDVKDEVRTRFGEFYAALFDKTLARSKGAVVTEYAWDASTCDPCPGPTLTGQDFLTLGADALPGKPQHGFVLTRLHARYTREELKDDLVFKAAPPIMGGREVYVDENELEQGSKSASVNNFQGRYAIRHVWDGPISCQNPIRGRWGGPPQGKPQPGVQPAQDTAFVPRGKMELTQVVRRHIPEIAVTAKTTTAQLMSGGGGGQAKASPELSPEKTPERAPASSEEGSSGCQSVPARRPALPLALLALLLAFAVPALRRR